MFTAYAGGNPYHSKSKALMICTIQIDDETNCKLIGLDADIRRKLVNRFKYEIPGARFQPAVRLGRWDGKVAYFQLGGSTYVNLLPPIMEIVCAAGYSLVLDDRRTYRNSYQFSEFKEDTFADCLWPVGHDRAGQPIMFRDYQVSAINGFLQNPQSVSVISTGAGKTIMTAALSKNVEQYGRSIVIVPSKSLVTQTEADYINMGLDVGVYFGDRKDHGKTHTICTWQSVHNLQKSTATDFTLDDFLDGVVCVIVDECHSSQASSLRDLLVGPMAKIPIRWGLTGTMPKEEHAKVSIECSIGHIAGKINAADLQAEGHLSNCHINIMQLIDYGEYKEYQQELKYLTENAGRLNWIAQFLDSLKSSGNTLILVDRIATGTMLQAYLSDVFSLLSDKPEVTFIRGSMKVAERKEEFASVESATSRITIATFGVAAVGINVVKIHNIVLFEAGKSFIKVIQSIGRGLRKGQDKDFVNVYDITSTCKFSKRHLTSRKKYYAESAYPFSVQKIDWQSQKGTK